MLAWLLGESAARYPLAGHGGEHPDQRPWPTVVDEAIGRARRRCYADVPMPPDIESLIETRLNSLRRQQQLCEEPDKACYWNSCVTAAMLPDAATLDRLIRYETHADRSLHRALETLAKLRGATVQTIRASLWRSGDGDACVEIHGKQTDWLMPQGPSGA